MAFEKQNVDFHVESDDCFGTLAAVLDIQTQKLKPNKEEGLYISEFLKILNETVNILDKKVEELKYLQEYYKITRKD